MLLCLSPRLAEMDSRAQNIFLNQTTDIYCFQQEKKKKNKTTTHKKSCAAFCFLNENGKDHFSWPT